MQVSEIKLDRVKARELYRKYKTHAHWSQPMDDAIRRTYQLIAQGRVVIRALDSIRAAGLNADGWPKLAIVRADARECFCRVEHNGSAVFSMSWRGGEPYRRRQWLDLPRGTFPAANRQDLVAEAVVPLIPLHLRPKRGLASYHLLWEAEWTSIVPIDPMLLRRLAGDLWLVVAAWDLTEVEQAALASRLNG